MYPKHCKLFLFFLLTQFRHVLNSPDIVPSSKIAAFDLVRHDITYLGNDLVRMVL